MKFLKCVFVIIEKYFGSLVIAIAIIIAAYIIGYYLNPELMNPFF